MALRAVVFDIGGVLELTPEMDFDRRWEARLGLPTGTVRRRLTDEQRQHRGIPPPLKRGAK